MWGNLKRIFH